MSVRRRVEQLERGQGVACDPESGLPVARVRGFVQGAIGDPELSHLIDAMMERVESGQTDIDTDPGVSILAQIGDSQ